MSGRGSAQKKRGANERSGQGVRKVEVSSIAWVSVWPSGHCERIRWGGAGCPQAFQVSVPTGGPSQGRAFAAPPPAALPWQAASPSCLSFRRSCSSSSSSCRPCPCAPSGCPPGTAVRQSGSSGPHALPPPAPQTGPQPQPPRRQRRPNSQQSPDPANPTPAGPRGRPPRWAPCRPVCRSPEFLG